MFSVDIDSIQEYNKRPRQTDSTETRRFYPRHVAQPSTLTLQECLALSDVVVSAVPNADYQVKTEWLKDGCICLNIAAEKNFEKDVRDKVTHPCMARFSFYSNLPKASLYIPAVGKVTILMLLRNLYVLSSHCVNMLLKKPL